jgi:phosphorylcholine metabolism protein LicD
MPKNRIADPAVLLENMVLIRDVLGARGIPVFLNFGTLLGAIRERGFIAHDDDADLEIFESDEEGFLSCLGELEARGLPMFGYVEEMRLYKFKRGGEQVDIFIAKRKSTLFGHRWNLEGRSTVPARHLDSLEEIDFLGHTFKIPADAQGLIRNLYGRNWMVPIENFPARLDWRTRLAKALRNPGKILFYARRFVTKRLAWMAFARKAGRGGSA